MPRVCTICTHPKRAEIEREVASRSGSIRAIADNYDVGRTALTNHLRDHISEKIAKAAAKKQVEEAISIIGTVQKILTRSEEISIKAQHEGDGKLSLSGLRETRETVKLLAELSGELDQGVTINLNQMTDEEVERRAREILAKRK